MLEKKKILVTGGAGFIGSNVVDVYINAGHEVTIIDNLSTGNKDFINPKADFIEMDICDKDIKKVFRDKKFDIINHHAAQIDVRKSVEEPMFDANVNILGSINLIENARLNNCEKFIFISSGGVMYGESEYPKDETTPAVPMSPYGITKRTVEHYLRFYSQAYGMKYTIFRYGNVYGPRQNFKGEAGVVAIFSYAMLNNKPVYIFGDGEQIRDYVFVEDIAKFNLKVLDKGENEIINIGTEKTTSVNELFEILADFYGYKNKPEYKEKRSGEIQKSQLDVTKLKNIFGEKCDYDVKNGLTKSVEFYKSLSQKV